MKTLLIMFIVGICALGLRSPEIMQAVGVATSAQDPARIELAAPTPAPMSADEFAQLSKTDSGAYRKFINSYQGRSAARWTSCSIFLRAANTNS